MRRTDGHLRCWEADSEASKEMLLKNCLTIRKLLCTLRCAGMRGVPDTADLPGRDGQAEAGHRQEYDEPGRIKNERLYCDTN